MLQLWQAVQDERIDTMLTNEQIAHDLAVAAAGVMLKNAIEKHPDIEEDKLLAHMVDYYKKTVATLQIIYEEKI